MRNLIHEIHRRSLWQVLGIYLAGSWVALQVVEQLTEAAGLPDWVRPLALVLLIVGLPVVLGTAFVQVPGTPHPGSGGQPEEASPGAAAQGPAPSSDPAAEVAPASGRGLRGLLTWRNATLGGVGAAAVIGISVGAYFFMRATGVGPAASLVAQGVIADGEPAILADFENNSDDPTLGRIVTEALRVDLDNGTALTLLSERQINEALRRMGRAPDEPLGADVAYEIAARDGIKAVIEGEVGSAGSGYILVARIGPAGGGAPLATFRRTAGGPEDIISAIDGLSQDLREKAGESLRAIRAEEPLEAVTTRSLEALERYAAADEAEERGDHIGSKRLYQEAVELDPEFAMAWRKLAVSVTDAGGTREEEIAAATRAYELRHRLTERERHLATAYYHDTVTGDVAEQERAYRAVLDRHPDDGTALNNLAITLADRLRFDESIGLLERAISGPGRTGSAETNLVLQHAWGGDPDAARAALELKSIRDDVWWMYSGYMIEMVAGEWEAAHAYGDSLVNLPAAPEAWRSYGRLLPGVVDAARGRLVEAASHFEEAARAAHAAGRPEDALTAWLFAATAERMVRLDPEAARALLRRARALLPDIASTERDYAGLVLGMARAGMSGEAEALLFEWEAEGALASGPQARSFGDVRDEVEALTRPEARDAVAALRRLRVRRDCPACLSSDIARALERAGDGGAAIEEYEQALSISEGGHPWFGPRRVMIHERLGELYAGLGNDRLAEDHYGAFLAAWAGADAEFEPRLDAIRARLAELRGVAE